MDRRGDFDAVGPSALDVGSVLGRRIAPIGSLPASRGNRVSASPVHPRRGRPAGRHPLATRRRAPTPEQPDGSSADWLSYLHLVPANGAASERLIEAIRRIERQKQVSGFASAEAWERLEVALVELDGRPLPPSVALRLDHAFND